MPEFLPFLRCGLLYSTVLARLTGIHFWRHCYFKDLGGITVVVPDHDGGRPIEVNACILITHMVYL
jgi:hypothetical protein